MTITPLRAASTDAGIERLRALVRDEFLDDYVPPDPQGIYSIQQCDVERCDRVRHGDRRPLCQLHTRHWRNAGMPEPIDGWIADADPRRVQHADPGANAAARGVFVLAPLAGQIRLEVAFGLQARATEGSYGRVRAFVFNDLVRRLAQQKIPTLQDVDAGDLIDRIGLTSSRASAVAFIRSTQSAIREAMGLSRRRSLGLRRGGSGYFADFSPIEPAWFGALVERWTNYRLAMEKVAPQTAGMQVAALARFSDFMVDRGARSPRDITRDLLVEFRQEINNAEKRPGVPYGQTVKSRWLGTLNTFLDDVRILEWEPDLPGNARFLVGELPRRPASRPRYISEFVMQQLEAPGALDRVKRKDLRVAILILMTTGIRMIHVLTLDRRCLEEIPRTAGQSAWAIRYLDTKTKQDMRVPIREDVATAIAAQQRAVRDEHGPDCEILFPRAKPGQVPFVSPQALHTAISNWCDALDLRDESGDRVWVTAHQFRHTCGTRWINNKVPPHIVKELLGHRSDAMVGVYARLHDATVRSEWEAYQRVTIAGDPVAPPDGDVAEVEWMIEQLSRATQALPNGYCALPIQQSCPHANACLSCDSFTTGPEFLPILEQQREQHQQMIESAESKGQQRLAEINRVPFVNLTNIIDGLKRLPVKGSP